MAITLDLKERTLRFAHAGRTIGTVTGVEGPVRAAVTVTSCKHQVGGWRGRHGSRAGSGAVGTSGIEAQEVGGWRLWA